MKYSNDVSQLYCSFDFAGNLSDGFSLEICIKQNSINSMKYYLVHLSLNELVIAPVVKIKSD